MKKKILASVMCLAMLASLGTSAWATDYTTFDTNITTTTADLDTAGLVFNLSVPTSLPIDVDSSGNVEVATDCKIVNNSGGMVKVTNVSLDTTDSGWTIVGYDTDFNKKQVGLTQFGITLNGDEVATDGSLSLGSEWVSLYANGGELAIDYEVNVASQSSALELTIATVQFTLDWDSYVDGTTDWVVEKYDLNSDGVVDSGDLDVISNHVAQTEIQTDEDILAKMDANGDGYRNIDDWQYLYNMINGTSEWA